MKEPEATFSACFGAAFLVGPLPYPGLTLTLTLTLLLSSLPLVCLPLSLVSLCMQECTWYRCR